MSLKNFLTLGRGDIVQHVVTGDSWLVSDVRMDGATVVRTMFINNPSEWIRVSRSLRVMKLSDKDGPGLGIVRCDVLVNGKPCPEVAVDHLMFGGRGVHFCAKCIDRWHRGATNMSLPMSLWG